MATAVKRFWAKVDTSGSCWLWTAGVDEDGYGRFWGFGSSVRAHVFAYELLVGKVAAGDHVHHRCESPGCVNPAHLELLSAADHQRTHLPAYLARLDARLACGRGHQKVEHGYHDGTQWRCRECLRHRRRSQRTVLVKH